MKKYQGQDINQNSSYYYDNRESSKWEEDEYDEAYFEPLSKASTTALGVAAFGTGFFFQFFKVPFFEIAVLEYS